MVEYKIIYPFEIMEKVMNGKTVGLVDRGEWTVYEVNCMSLSEVSKVLKDYDKSKGRYEFWVEEEQEVTEE